MENSATTAPMIDKGKQMRAAANRKGKLDGIRRWTSTSKRDASREAKYSTASESTERSPTSEFTSIGKKTMIPVTR